MLLQHGMGYWGPVTANYDWCEPNYRVTPYVAEFWNTLSSVPIVIGAVIFIRVAYRLRYESRFYGGGAAVAVIGAGSVAFHGTLTRAGQILDELPMLWCALFFLWIVVSTEYDPGHTAAGRRQALRSGFVMLAFGVAGTAAYFANSFGFFISCYAVTIAAVTAASVRHVWRASAECAAGRPILVLALLCYLGGTALLWLPEQLLCGNRLHAQHQSALQDLPVPLHSFFHLTSAAGPYLWLTWAAYSRLHAVGRRPSIASGGAADLGLPVAHPECMV
eukprot:TRINITY_DN71187_c0_g1_i1.p1 TRINITY_DN71187_c0_g1~~TRINITY_DN71187_c0_g1_i1.p1  ORF type:complete len:276 (+),score=62.94 TRINITY_DN71187_c0_g1_i1:85-912(+)